jgi:DNA-binding transcriptional regulator PaaX
MFSAWQQEKATEALVADAQAVADRLASAKPHVVDSTAATAWFWAASLQADGQDLYAIARWPAAAVARFVTATQTRIAALRKKRDYDLSDGLAVWLHTARALKEPRIAPPVQDIWHLILNAGPNADTMATDLMAEAGLTAVLVRQAPAGIAPDAVNET